MKFKYTTLLLASFLFNTSYAWENEFTHPAITTEAVSTIYETVDNYLITQLGLNDGLSTTLHWDFPLDIERRASGGSADPGTKDRTVLDWIKLGSTIEDEDSDFASAYLYYPSWRPRHHFHDPTRNGGLDNVHDHPDWRAPWSSWLPLGQSALAWATTGTASYDPRNNHDKWDTVRTLFYQALKEEDSTTREARLAESLMKLGCVLHLLEDQGVPAHTRNDFLFGHYRSVFDHGNDLETNIEKCVILNSGQSLWSGSYPVVFGTVAKYFDTDSRYGANADAYLGNGNTPPNTWGLSECTNYQFLSLSTIFRHNDGNLQYFPHPSLGHIQNITTIDNNGKMYFDGSNYGVPHMARASYTYYKIASGGYILPPSVVQIVDNKNTTDDGEVIADYANITIPRTINYAAGLINYFFRGKLEVEAHTIESGGSVAQITITNKSMNGDQQQALKGGNFELYACYLNDDRITDSERVPVTLSLSGWSNGVLNYNQSLTGTFNIPSTSPPIAFYGVVYKGQIVPNDNCQEDPSDTQAIAWGQTDRKVALYFGNCASFYQDNPSWYEEDLSYLRETCQGWKAGFYFTPRWWPRPDDPYEQYDFWPDDNPADECTACCTSSLSDIIPDGYDYPEDIHFETRDTQSSTLTSSDIEKYGRDLLGGATPEWFLIAHGDRPSMYDTWDDWIAWEPDPCRYIFDCIGPGEGSILGTSFQDWGDDSEIQAHHAEAAEGRDGYNMWLYGIALFVQLFEEQVYNNAAVQNNYANTALQSNYKTTSFENNGNIAAIQVHKKALVQACIKAATKNNSCLNQNSIADQNSVVPCKLINDQIQIGNFRHK